MPATRRRRGCLPTLLAVLVLLAVVAVVADRATCALTQRGTAGVLNAAVDDSEGVDVDIRGFPFLTQLAAGTLGDVQVRADRLTLNGFTVVDAEATATDVHLRDEQRAENVTVTGTLTTEQIAQTLRERTGWDIALTSQNGALTASTAVLGVPAALTLTVTAAGADGLAVSVAAVTLGGVAVDPDALPSDLIASIVDLTSLTDRLPATAAITDVTVTDAGLRATITATDVTLDDL